MRRLWGVLGGLLLLAAGGCTCNSEMEQQKKFEQIEREIALLHDPESFITEMREYAVEKLPNASEKELTVITNEKPNIKHNYDCTEFSFLWNISDKLDVEVLTTPPPCDPIAVYRVRKIVYP